MIDLVLSPKGHSGHCVDIGLGEGGRRVGGMGLEAGSAVRELPTLGGDRGLGREGWPEHGRKQVDSGGILNGTTEGL